MRSPGANPPGRDSVTAPRAGFGVARSVPSAVPGPTSAPGASTPTKNSTTSESVVAPRKPCPAPVTGRYVASSPAAVIAFASATL